MTESCAKANEEWAKRKIEKKLKIAEIAQENSKLFLDCNSNHGGAENPVPNFVARHKFIDDRIPFH